MSFPREPLLDVETERTLARRWVRHGDLAARDRLVCSHLRLVMRIAREYRWSRHDVDDLAQEGSLGLILALRRFDPERGVRLSSYAAWWIRASILRFIIDNWRLVRIGTTLAQRKVMTRAGRERAALERDGEPPSEGQAELEAHVRVPELSIDAGHDAIATDEEQRPDRLVERLDERRAVARAARELEAGLDPRERALFRARWLGSRNVTLQQMGTKFGISRERARQLEARTLAKLRVILEVRLAA